MSTRLPTSLAAYRLLTQVATPLARQLLAYRLNHGKEHPVRNAERRVTRGGRGWPLPRVSCPAPQWPTPGSTRPGPAGS